MIRLSVTDLESYRYWKAREDQGLDALVRSLKHEDPPSPQMMAGKAFAKLFETAGTEEITYRDVDGWRFCFADLGDAEIELSPVRELKAEMRFDTPSGPVMLVGKVDSLHGLTVHDQKLTERWDAERYVDSLQWRAYLVMFGARAFVYDVFTGRYDGTTVYVYDYQPMTFYAYPGMRGDVEQAVTDLASIVAEHIPSMVSP